MKNFEEFVNSINEIYKLEEYKNVIENRINILIKKSNGKEIPFFIQEIEYKGSGKSWIAIVDKNSEIIDYLKKEFIKSEKNRKFYKVNLQKKKIYLVNTEGEVKKDKRFYLFIDEYGEKHYIQLNEKEKIKEIIEEIIQ